MKEKELNELIDSAVGIKGNLRLPAYWMKKILKGLMEWCKTLVGNIKIPEVYVPKNLSEFDNDVGFVDQTGMEEAITASKKIIDFLTITKSNNIRLRCPSSKGISIGAFDWVNNNYHFEIYKEDFGSITGFNEFKILAFVKSLSSTPLNLDLSPGIYLLTVSFFSNYANYNYYSACNVSVGSRLSCSWARLVSDEGNFIIIQNTSSIANTYQFGWSTDLLYLDSTGNSCRSSSTNLQTKSCDIPIVGNTAYVNASNATTITIYGDAQYFTVANSTYLKSLYLDSTILKISSTNIKNCNQLVKIVFRHNTVVPTITSSSLSLPSSCKIVVPDTLYDQWITTEGWVDIKSQIVKASEYTE